MLVARDAVLTETRETVEALTVSALQQAPAASHRADVTAESFYQAHKDMAVTTREHARKKQPDFLEGMELYDEVHADDLPVERYVWKLDGHDENTQGVEIVLHGERIRGNSQ